MAGGDATLSLSLSPQQLKTNSLRHRGPPTRLPTFLEALTARLLPVLEEMGDKLGEKGKKGGVLW